jgi:SAM-dependent methyltransferase
VKDYDAKSFGDLHADEYDALHNPGTTEEAVDLLADLAGAGKVLELAIGTGRVALPLAARGLEVHGVEASEKMVAKLREKPGGENLPVTIADMADFSVRQEFDFVYLIFNTLCNLTSQAAQVSCFQSVARHLNPGGAFLIETFVPDLSRFTDGQSVRVKQLDFGSLILDAAVHDPVKQTIEFQRVGITEAGLKLLPLPMRYAWPAEIDLMAQLAGLELEARWGGWARTPFTAESDMHISVYRKGG